MGVHLNHPFVNVFSIINHPFWGTSIYGIPDIVELSVATFEKLMVCPCVVIVSCFCYKPISLISNSVLPPQLKYTKVYPMLNQAFPRGEFHVAWGWTWAYENGTIASL